MLQLERIRELTRLGRRKWLHRVSATLAIVAAYCFTGCGGSNSLTGGSIPIGTAKIIGRVGRSSDLTSSVPGAEVKLTSGQNSDKLISDAIGNFDFGSVTSGPFLCEIAPPPGSALGSGWAFPFELQDNSISVIVAQLWPDTFDPGTVTNVTLMPSSATLKSGTTTRLIATVYGGGGAVSPVNASFLIAGNAGTLDPDGTFHATQPGKCTITAWMPGFFAKATIIVSP